MLDTLREMEVSGLRRGGGQQYPQYIGPRTKSRRYLGESAISVYDFDRRSSWSRWWRTGYLHAPRARTLNRGRSEESPGASRFHQEIPQVESVLTMGRVRVEGARLLLRGQPPREVAGLVSRPSPHREQRTGQPAAFARRRLNSNKEYQCLTTLFRHSSLYKK